MSDVIIKDDKASVFLTFPFSLDLTLKKQSAIEKE